MPFAYYHRLTRAQQRVYQRSDQITSIRLPAITLLSQEVDRLREALRREDRQETEAVCQKLVSLLITGLRVNHVLVEVMAVRPSRGWGELHGLYTHRQGRRPAMIVVWMRTAERHQVVAFRTFLRTLIHELCHHLDYDLLKLPESFHTEGFYKRESSLVHQLADTTSYK